MTTTTLPSITLPTPSWGELQGILVDTTTDTEKLAKAEQFITNYQILPGDTSPETLATVEELIYQHYTDTFPTSPPLVEGKEELTFTSTDTAPIMLGSLIHPDTDHLHTLFLHEHRLYLAESIYGPAYTYLPLLPASTQPVLVEGKEMSYYQALPAAPHVLFRLGVDWAKRHFPEGLDGKPVGATLVDTVGSLEDSVHGPSTLQQTWRDNITGDHYTVTLTSPDPNPDASKPTPVWTPVKEETFITQTTIVFPPIS